MYKGIGRSTEVQRCRGAEVQKYSCKEELVESRSTVVQRESDEPDEDFLPAGIPSKEIEYWSREKY